MKATYYHMALQNPSVVAWYCTLKLEMAVHLVQELVTRMLQSDVVPGRGQAMELLAGQLQERLGVEISVDDLPAIRNYGAADDLCFSGMERWRAHSHAHCFVDCWCSSDR